MPTNAINPRKLAALYNSQIKRMLSYEMFGRKVRFIYPPKVTDCPNCIRGSSGSTGVYKQGGPHFFENTTCPVCLGRGLFEESVTEESVMIVLFDANAFFEPATPTH